MNETATPSAIFDAIKQGAKLPDSPISLSQFAEVQKLISNDSSLRHKMNAFVVIYGDKAREAVVCYPAISQTRIPVCHQTRLTPDDFNRFLYDAEIVGNIEFTSKCDRIREEKASLIVAATVFLITFLLMFFSTTSAAGAYSDYVKMPNSYPATGVVVNFYEKIGDALLTFLAVFLSVFVLFTISQNAVLASNLRLYKSGQVHKYIRDDRYIAFVAGGSLLFAFLGFVMTSLPVEISLSIIGLDDGNKLNLLIPLCYSVSIAGLVICIISLAYYPKRALVASEQSMVFDLLHEKYRRLHTQQQTEPHAKNRPNGN